MIFSLLVHFAFLHCFAFVRKQCRPDQMPHFEASEIGLYYKHVPKTGIRPGEWGF